MAKGFKHGVGGGAPLNFKVVGNPQPSNPSENTIWLNTDVDITGWYFTSTQPEDMKQGEVWFFTGTSSVVAFSATKKNPVMVCPLSAKQYVDGALVAVTAKSYQSGEWVDWCVYLLNGSDFCEDITGGWSVNSDITGFTVTPSQITSDGLVLTSGSGARMGRVQTKKIIDLTEANTLKFDIDVYTKFNKGMRVFASQNPTGKVQLFEAETQFSSSGTISLDVSNLGAGFYVGVCVYNESANPNANSKITIKAVRQE